MTTDVQSESHSFQAEVSKLLHLMVHSVYSEKEVFLRELISNASDACDKLRYELLTKPNLIEGEANFTIAITLDKEARTLSIADNGIGMDRAELIDNLGTIARSGTSHFVEQMSGDAAEDSQLIGQFGVGFYSSFMVAAKVEVISLKAGEDTAHIWSSTGEGAFDIASTEDTSKLLDGRGTHITLHLREGEDDFLEDMRVRHVIKSYSDHIAMPIYVAGGGDDGEGGEDDSPVNAASALWTRAKSDITDDQYKEFYHHVGHVFDEPSLTIHYKAEGRHEYAVLLFVPTERPMDLFDPAREPRARLYVKRVFITDEAKLLPGYLRFVRGIVDSEDMPLNISREMLQNNPIVASIRNALTKRVLNEIGKAADKDTDKFTKIWESFGAVLKEGLYEDGERRDTLLDLARFTTTTGEMRSFKDYVADMKENQTAIYYIHGEDPDTIAQSPQLEGFKARGIEVLLLSDPVDAFWTTNVFEFDGQPFQSVAQGSADLEAIPVIDVPEDEVSEPAPQDDQVEEAAESKDEVEAEDQSEDNQETAVEQDDQATDDEVKEDKVKDETVADILSTATLVGLLKETLKGNVSDVRDSQRLTSSPVCLVSAEGSVNSYMERILAQSQGKGTPDLLASRILEINPKHPLIQKLASEAEKDGALDALADAAYLLLDQARILEGEQVVDIGSFAKRLARLMEKAV